MIHACRLAGAADACYPEHVIVAVGTSPAWQRTLELSSLALGAVNRVNAVHECAAGKAVNVAVAAHGLGERSVVLTTAGGLLGQRLSEDLSRLGVEQRLVRVATPTRICTTLLADAGVTEVVEPAGNMTDQEASRFLEEFAGLPLPGAVVLSGSLARGVPSSFYGELVRRAQGPVVVDASGPELLAALDAGPLVVKPSRSELERTVGCTLTREQELREAMVLLVARGARWVVVSDGGATLWALGQGQVHRAEPPRVRVVNPIGSGDCLAAGIACGIARGLVIEECVRFGIACAAANAATLLPARFELDAALRLLDSVTVRRA